MKTGRSGSGSSRGRAGGGRAVPHWRKPKPEKRGPQYPARPGGSKPSGIKSAGSKLAGEAPEREIWDRDVSDRPKRAAASRPPRAGQKPPASPGKPPRPPRVAPQAATQAEAKAATAEALATGVQMLVVMADETGMRVDRFLESRFPQLPFALIQRVIRKGELRIDGKRAEAKDRLEEGQKVRVPPMKLAPAEDRPKTAKPGSDTARFLKEITLYEDADVLVLNKPAGLAVQGGSGTVRHVDGMLDAVVTPDGQRARLVHRLDKDTAGCLLIAKSRFAAAALAKTFRSRAARKIYWAMVAGVPRVRQGRISTYLARDEARDGDSRVEVVKHGDDGAMHAVSYYAVVETSAQKLAWLSLKPVTGRTHQLRAHAAHIGHPIIGDPKYFNVENWELPGGIQNKLHLLARRIVVPHPRGKGVIDVSAPLPPHMKQSWNLLGLDESRYDPVVDAPDQ